MPSAKVAKKIKDEAARVRTAIIERKKPSMKFPLRALTNVKYQPRVGYLEMKGKTKERTLTVDAAYIKRSIEDPRADIVKGFENGAVDYVTKPFNSAELLARTQTHLELKFTTERLQAREQELILLTRKLEEANHVLMNLSLIDSLTGIGNRRQFDQAMEVEWRRSSRNSKPIGLIMIDIDHFKPYNDTYGHQAGDDCLKQVAAALKAGHSFKQGLQTIVDEGQEPASKELSRVITDTRLGRPMDEALAETAERIGSKNFSFVITAVTIQRQVGGNLAEVLQNTVGTMRERAYLRRQVRALSAEARLSAYILSVLPPLVGCWLLFIDPTYMRPLYTTLAGLLLLAVTVVLYVVGVLWMRKVIRVVV